MRAAYILSLAAATGARAAPPPRSASNKPQITSVTYSGTGCAQNGVGVLVAAAGDSAALIFDSFLLDGGRNANVSCEIRLTMRTSDGEPSRGAERVPDDATTPLQVDIRGFAAGGGASSGVSGIVQARVSSRALAAELNPPAVFRLADGAAGGNEYSISGQARIKFPTGGRPVTASLNTELLMVAGRAQAGGILTVDSINIALNPA